MENKYLFQEELEKLEPGDKIKTYANIGRKNRTVTYLNNDGETPAIKLGKHVFHWNFFFQANTIVTIIKKK